MQWHNCACPKRIKIQHIFPLTFSHSANIIEETFHFQLCFQKANKALMNTSKQSHLIHLHKCFRLLFLWPFRQCFIKKSDEKLFFRTISHNSRFWSHPAFTEHLYGGKKKKKKSLKKRYNSLQTQGLLGVFSARSKTSPTNVISNENSGKYTDLHTHGKYTNLHTLKICSLKGLAQTTPLVDFEWSPQLIKVLILHYLWWLKCI